MGFLLEVIGLLEACPIPMVEHLMMDRNFGFIRSQEGSLNMLASIGSNLRLRKGKEAYRSGPMMQVWIVTLTD
jgi:hypothetical protein